MFKRIFLFIAVNVLVLITISLTLNVLGIQPYLSSYGIDYPSLLAFCAVVGFSGALISLALSRVMAKMMLGVQVIDPGHPASTMERDLIQLVHRLAQKAHLPAPEVGIYESPEMNAFATGPSRSKALVAVSSGLLQRMDISAIEGVLGHEISHISNGDMVTMTLLQGVVNTFVMFFARIAAWALSNALAGNRDDGENRGPNPLIHLLSVVLFEILFSLLGAIVVAYFSRRREFRADKGSADLNGKEKMIHALEVLKRETFVDDHQAPVATLKISGHTKTFLSLLASHPDIDLRISSLRGPRPADKKMV